MCSLRRTAEARAAQTDLGRAPVGALLIRLAAPSICAQVVNLLYSIVDRIYIGHIPGIGAAALTGVGVTVPVTMLITAFASLIGMGGAPRASICMGQGDDRRAEGILGNCVTALLAISLMLTALLLGLQTPLLRGFGASAETLPYALQYLGIYVYGTVFVQLALGLGGFIAAQGRALAAMLSVVIGAALNIALDPVLIFTLGMGVRGAALATVISQAVSAGWVLCFLCGRSTRLRIRRVNLRPRRAALLSVIGLGASPFVMQATEALLCITFNRSLQQYGGDLAVGAMAILTSLMQIVNMPLVGLTAGAQPILSYNLGARQPARMAKTVRLLVTAALCYSVSFFVVVQLFPDRLAAFFTEDPTLIAFAAWAMRVYFATIFVIAIQNSFQQSFIALGEAKISLFLALLRKMILLIPMILLLPRLLSNTVFAVFLAEPVSDFISAVVVAILFCRRFRAIVASLSREPDNEAASVRHL